MARIDYAAHQLRFLQMLKSDPSITVIAYCEGSGLKYASAKRYIKKPKKAELDAELAKIEEQVEEKKDKEIEKLPPKKRVAITGESRTKAKQKWAELVTNFLTRAAKNPSLTIAQFAKENDVKAATLRRNIQELRNDRHFRSLFDLFDRQLAEYRAIKGGNSAKNAGKTKGKAVGGESPKTGKTAQVKGSDGSNVAEIQSESAQKSPDSGPESAQDAQLDEVSDHFAQFSAERFQETQDSRAELKTLRDSGNFRHGGYCGTISLMKDMVDVLSKVDPLSVSDELLMARARYYRMNKTIDDRIRHLESLAERGEETISIGDNEVPIDEAIRREIFSAESRLGALEYSIANLASVEAKRLADQRKQVVEELRMPHYLPAEETALVVKLLHMRDAKGWDAITTAKNIERLGAKVPPALMAELRNELETAEPEVIEGEVTPEEFERRNQAYFAALEEKEAKAKKDKQESLAAIFEEFDPDEAGDFLPVNGGDDGTA